MVNTREKTRLAVLMTCHNRVANTVECLESLVKQNECGAAMDLILVDDCSTDGTASAITEAVPDAVIIQGDGNLFWCGGMRAAFAHAMQKQYDFFLWINDDTHLYEDALLRIFRTYADVSSQLDSTSIIVGSTCDRKLGTMTYGGWRQRAGKLGSISWVKITPQAEHWTSCDTMNGNYVLIPRSVVEKVGNLDANFTHSMGDLDYGLRARAAGCQIVLAPGYYGTCSANDGAGLWTDDRLPLLVRWKKLLGPKGLPISEWMVFSRRHKGKFWIIVWLSPYVMFWVKALLNLVGLKR